MTSTLRFVTLCVAFAAAVTSSLAQMPASSTSAWVDCSGLPCVEVTANGIPLKMLIDTGNANSVLDLAKAKELGLELKPLLGPDGKPYVKFSTATIKNIKLGDMVLGDVEVLVANLQPTIQKGKRPAGDGSLAYTAFADRILTIDYKQQKISASEVLKTDIPCPGSAAPSPPPPSARMGHPSSPPPASRSTASRSPYRSTPSTAAPCSSTPPPSTNSA
jgi:hypothetical protein